MPGVTGLQYRRVELPPGNPRGGVMTQAAVLKVTANGTSTSPVIRGVWMLENIFGKPVPPPPAGVPAVEPDVSGAVTLRDQLELHRDVASCAGCHDKIDPPGFALERFDPIGGWRDWYRSTGNGDRITDRFVDPPFNRIRVRYRKAQASSVHPTAGLLPTLMSSRRLSPRIRSRWLTILPKSCWHSPRAGTGFSDRAVLKKLSKSHSRTMDFAR